MVKMSSETKSPHLASSLSCVDIIATLYHSVLRFKHNKPKWDLRDRFILSKGHAATALYVTLESKKIISPSIDKFELIFVSLFLIIKLIVLFWTKLKKFSIFDSTFSKQNTFEISNKFSKNLFFINRF